MTLQPLPGITLPIIQAPMAGAQDSALAVSVSNAGGLGSLPCATLSPDALRNELAILTARDVPSLQCKLLLLPAARARPCA